MNGGNNMDHPNKIPIDSDNTIYGSSKTSTWLWWQWLVWHGQEKDISPPNSKINIKQNEQ